ncbi:MAG: hypothetical protein OK457_06820 [Thaumarchaeota archaeon]|nr:hypothetical protein [Nitrososphaerota archaeon]
MIYFRDGSTSYGVSPEEAKKRFESALGGDFRFVYPKTDNENELDSMIQDCDALVGTSATLDEKIARVILNSRSMGFIQCIGAGVENFPVERLKGSKIQLADASGASAIAVAEHAFSLMISLTKKITYNDSQIKKGIWKKEPLLELWNKTVTILGLGSIGMELAKRSIGFGMNVIGIQKHPREELSQPRIKVAGLDQFRNSLRETDYLVISLPLTSETRNLIGENEFRLMKKSAFIINVARGVIVNETALRTALEKGWISGAGIDTWYAYPPSSDTPSASKIHLLPNVIATAHVASTTSESVERTFDLVINNLRELSATRKFKNLVDPHLGY